MIPGVLNEFLELVSLTINFELDNFANSHSDAVLRLAQVESLAILFHVLHVQ